MSSISVQITADVADLTAKLAVAKAEVSSANVELRDMAQQMAAAGNAASGELKSGLASAAQTAASARAELAALNTQLKETQAGTGGLAASFTGMRESMEATMAPMTALNSLITTFSEVFLVAFVGERIISGIEHIAQLGANLVKLHEQTGVAVETLSGWHYAAEQVDVSAESLDTAMLKLGSSIQTALKTPTSLAAEAFHAMGISQAELAEHSNDLQYMLMRVANAFHEHADGEQAAAIARAAFGRSGADLLPLLREGAEKIQEETEKQKELGSQMTGPMAQAMKEHRQAVKDMGEAWSSFGIEITSMLAGPGTHLANWLTDLAKGMEVLKQKLNEKMGYVPNSPMAGDLAGKGSWASVPTPKGKPEFGNIGGDGEPKENAFDKYLKEKDKRDREQANRDMLADAQKTGRDLEKYWAEAEKAEIAGFEKTGVELKQYADDNYQNYKLSIDEQKDAAKGNYDEQLRLDQQLVTRAKELYGQDAAHFHEAMKVKFADLRAQVDQQMQPWNNLVHGIGNSFQQMFTGVLQGTQTWRQMMAHLADSLLATFANMAIKSAETWALSKIREVLVTQQAEVQKTAAVAAGEASRTAEKAAGAAEGKAVDAAAGSTSVFGDAYKAAAGAFSAVAGIPYIGPFIAPAAAAAAFAAVMAFDVFSAAGGFDVGPGQTPMTQLHPREMVLPAGISEMFRGMARDGGGGPMGASATIHNHFHFSGQSQNDDFRRSTRQMVAEQRRTFEAAMA